MASEIKVDTISEKTSANGVTIDGVSLKDSKIATANSVDSDAYVDASIDNAHLADNAVDTAEIADNAVTLAKMDGLARGTLIYGDASGDPAALAVGAANEVLTHDGTDFDWAAASGFDVSSITGATALATQPASDDEIVISDGGVLKRLDIKHIQNTPAFHGYNTTTTALSSGAWTKVPIDTEVFDSDGTFDSTTNYRWTPGVAGYYLLWGHIKIPGIDDNEGLQTMIKKNGTFIGGQSMIWSTGTDNALGTTTINSVYSDTNDYFELFAYQNSGDSQNYDGVETGVTGNTHFGGMRISGV